MRVPLVPKELSKHVADIFTFRPSGIAVYLRLPVSTLFAPVFGVESGLSPAIAAT